MARQSKPEIVDFECETTADLTSLPRLAVTNGCRAWVSAAGATHGLWCLDNQSTDAVGAGVVATSDGVGRWIFFGASGAGGATLSVANEAALTALAVGSLPEGTIAYVQSHRTYWSLRTQALALRPNLIIASSSAARQWLRTPTASPSWAIQYAPNVFVDSVAGNNENDGLTNVTALLNADELARRVPVLMQPITVNAVGTGGLGTFAWNPNVSWNPALSATVPSVTIEGVRTAGALPAGATGVLATSTNVVGNTPPQISDTGGAGVVWATGTILEATSGVSNGARSYVMNDEGGGVASVGVWRNAAGTANIAPPAPGDTYRVITLTQVSDLQALGGIVFTFKNIQLLAWSLAAQVGCPGVVFNISSLTVATLSPAPGTSVTINSSYYTGSVFLVQAGVIVGCSGTSFNRKGVAQPMRCTAGGRLGLSNGYVQGDNASHGVAIAGPFANDGVSGGSAFWSNFGVRGVGASAAVAVRKGGVLNITGAYWGDGNALQGTQCKEGGRIAVQAAVVPTLASVGQELEIQGAATAATVVAQVPAAAAALVSWANWVAGPFTRNAMDYIAGSVVADAA